jgi:carboxylesterase type B
MYTPESKRIASVLGDAIFIVCAISSVSYLISHNGTVSKAPRRLISNLFSRASLPVYAYHFSHVSELPYLGSYHGSEVPYVFGETPDPLAAQMMALWISFANTMDPNNYGSFAGAEGVPYWPEYGAGNMLMEFGIENNTVVADNFRVDPVCSVISSDRSALTSRHR